MSVEEKNAYEITKKLAFPRLVGTEGYKKAVGIVEEEFQRAGYDSVNREKFKTSLYSWNLSRWAFLPISFLLVLIAYSIFINPWLMLIFLAVFLLFANKGLKMISPEEMKLSKNKKYIFEAENVFVNLKSKNSKATVVVMAHLDSKGQIFPKIVTIFLFIVPVFGYLILCVLYLILSIVMILLAFENLVLFNVLFVVSVIIAIISGLNSFNKVNNVSSGASDDGAGVGAIIELSRFFKKNSLENIDLIFFATGAEELDTGGSRNFIGTHKNEFDPEKTFFINLDSFGGKEPARLISSFGIPKRSGSKILGDLFLESAKELNVILKDIYIPAGAWSDFMPMVRAGFEACWLDFSSDSIKYVHTRKDTISIISQEALKKGILLCVDVIKKLNKKFS